MKKQPKKPSISAQLETLSMHVNSIESQVDYLSEHLVSRRRRSGKELAEIAYYALMCLIVVMWIIIVIKQARKK